MSILDTRIAPRYEQTTVAGIAAARDAQRPCDTWARTLLCDLPTAHDARRDNPSDAAARSVIRAWLAVSDGAMRWAQRQGAATLDAMMQGLNIAVSLREYGEDEATVAARYARGDVQAMRARLAWLCDTLDSAPAAFWTAQA